MLGYTPCLPGDFKPLGRTALFKGPGSELSKIQFIRTQKTAASRGRWVPIAHDQIVVIDADRLNLYYVVQMPRALEDAVPPCVLSDLVSRARSAERYGCASR
jgi:hypothetical protein